MKENKYTLSSLYNALILIDFLADNGPIPLIEISNKLEFGKSSIFRMLSTLEQAGYVEKSKTLEYTLSPKFITLASKVLKQRNDDEIVKNYLLKIKNKFNESAHYGIISSDFEVLILNKVSGDRSIQMSSVIGGRLPVYASALGKCILANSDDPILHQKIKSLKMEEFTKNTITSYDSLNRELKLIKDQGYAMDNEEAEDGLTCVAVPIFDYTNKVTSAISISGPTSRMSRNKDSIIDFMIQMGNELSNELGCSK